MAGTHHLLFPQDHNLQVTPPPPSDPGHRDSSRHINGLPENLAMCSEQRLIWLICHVKFTYLPHTYLGLHTT